MEQTLVDSLNSDKILIEYPSPKVNKNNEPLILSQFVEKHVNYSELLSIIYHSKSQLTFKSKTEKQLKITGLASIAALLSERSIDWKTSSEFSSLTLHEHLYGVL